MMRALILVAVGLFAGAGLTGGDAGSEVSDGPQFLYPRIAEHGKVVHLPEASDQPRDGSQICVDVTAGGPAEAINPAIEKVARFLNIYAGAGKEPAAVQVTVLLHGDATLASLSDDAYAARFDVAQNPNLPLIREMKDAGVEFVVCGQAVVFKGARHSEVDEDIQIAVSGLTVNVNRQQDGYAFIPLH